MCYYSQLVAIFIIPEFFRGRSIRNKSAEEKNKWTQFGVSIPIVDFLGLIFLVGDSKPCSWCLRVEYWILYMIENQFFVVESREAEKGFWLQEVQQLFFWLNCIFETMEAGLGQIAFEIWLQDKKLVRLGLDRWFRS